MSMWELWEDLGFIVKCRTATCHYVQDVVETGCIDCPCEECCKNVRRLYKLMRKCRYEWWALDSILEEG